MLLRYYWLAAAAHFVACVRASGDYMSASSPLVLWGGRPFLLPGGEVAFDWEGTFCTFAVLSPQAGATVTLRTNISIPPSFVSRLSVYINDYEAQNLLLHPGTQSYLLAAGLQPGVNNVTVAYAIEPLFYANALQGEYVTFVGFSAGNGGSFVAPSPLRRRIDVIGDSISAGSMYDKLEGVNGALSLNTGCHPWSPLYGYSQQFAWENYLCRYFRANCTTIAWSGGTLLPAAQCPGRQSLPEHYPYTFATAMGSSAFAWDFSRTATPDAVIVFLGTNDFAACPNITTPAFASALVDLFTRVISLYASSPPPASGRPPHFFAALGPMSIKPLPALQSAIAAAAAQGISASLLNMSQATLDGCGSHPGPIGHWEMALAAKAQISEALGW
jgi:hypothetical protein